MSAVSFCTDPPIGSGPYRIDSFELGRSVTYVRRPDWWAANMPTGKGTNNFDRVRVEYFRDSTVAMEAFKPMKRLRTATNNAVKQFET